MANRLGVLLTSVVPHSDIQVALSYASEQEAYVKTIDYELIRLGVRTFFFPVDKKKYIGENVEELLYKVFNDWAIMCVMFISKDYGRKSYPSFERRIAITRQIKRDSEYIFPIRFDNTEIEGLANDVYANANEYSFSEMALAIRQRLLTLVNNSNNTD